MSTFEPEVSFLVKVMLKVPRAAVAPIGVNSEPNEAAVDPKLSLVANCPQGIGPPKDNQKEERCRMQNQCCS